MAKKPNRDEPQNFYFQWHITNKCNLRCSHCYQESYTDQIDLSIDELKAIADKIFVTMAKWNKKGDISITGGEPFIKKELFPLMTYLDSSDNISRLDVLCNGIFITDKIAQDLKKIRKLNNVQVSLDGATSMIHDQIRGTGTFEKAMKGIRTLVNHGIDVKVMFTLQQLNKEEIPDLIALAIRENISGLTIERMVPTGSGRDKKDAILSPRELEYTFQYISDRADLEYQKGHDLRILKYRPLWINLDPCRANADSGIGPHEELGAICSIGYDGLCIMPDASVLACRRLPITIGNLKTDSIEKIWFESELLCQIRDKRNLKGKCKSCEHIPRCSGCRSMAYAVTGDYLAEDPQCWKSE
ncbi:MAG: radical SAM protein [Methanoregula sp.]|nr:radical SAM protein [Methanoregula sp.]